MVIGMIDHEVMSFLRLLMLILVVSVTTAEAADYELRITYTPGTREMRDGFRKNVAGVYEFTDRADYVAARDAFEDLDAKLIALDNGIREERGTKEERYQRFLVRLKACQDASRVLKDALARAK